MRELVIDNTLINDNSECYVIAEIGHNHQGNLEKAKELFRSAKECGVNAVKLQKRDNRSLFIRKMYDLPYENENSFGPTYGTHREALEFGYEQYVELKQYASELGLTMFATPFDTASVDFLEKLEVPAYKIASGDLKNTPFLKYVAQTDKPMIISTGGGTIEDVQRAYDIIMPINPKLCMLQCTASYPVEPEYMNLRVITTYRKRFPDIVIGLSDHQSGIAMSVVAFALGARVIEKHFTLNRAWKGTDHAFSLEPVGLHKLVRDLQRARVALGDGIKRPFPCEEKPLNKMGKKLVAICDLPAGHVLTHKDIAIKSPNDGLPPYEMEKIIGMATRRSLRQDENILFEDLQGVYGR
jgi:N-acetylneuraminate synthase/sialic acid synthase